MYLRKERTEEEGCEGVKEERQREREREREGGGGGGGVGQGKLIGASRGTVTCIVKADIKLIR